MNSIKLLEKLARQMERENRGQPPQPAPPAEPRELWEVYFLDPYRPRLSAVAHLVWDFLLHRADPESRIASVSFREIKIKTGLRSNRSLQRALEELARFGYCIPSTFPTGHCQPRNYKIPEHITPTRFAHPEVARLARQADQPRRRPRQTAGILNKNAYAAPVPLPAKSPAPAPADPPAPPKPTPPHHPPMPDLELPALDLKNLQALNLDERIEQLGQEVDQLHKALPTKAAGPDQGR